MKHSPMNIVLVHFSQTGNTEKLSEAFAGAFRGNGHTVRVLSLKDARPPDFLNCDMLGFGAPCFESQAPTPVKEFLRTLPQLPGKPAFVFATSGGAPGRVLYDLSSGLEKKGAAVIGGYLSRGMVHHPAPCLTGRMPDRPDENDLERARSFALAVDRHLKTGSSFPPAEGKKNVLKPGWGFYDLISLIARPFLLRILLPKPKPDRSLCNQCGVCSQECPVRCIARGPYPVLSRECIRCYRCMNACPLKALNVSWQFGNLVIFMLYNTLFIRIFGDLEPGERIY